MSARRVTLTPATAAAVAILAILFAVLFLGLSWLTPASASAAGTTPASAADVAAAVSGVGGQDGCLGPDIRCEVTDAAKIAEDLVDSGAVGAGVGLVPGLPDPLGGLGDTVAAAAADAWTAAMLALWSAGLFVLRVVLAFADAFLTPDLSERGPGQNVYMYTFWIASSLVTVMVMIQLGVAAFKRDGKSLARVAIGAGQFVIVWSCWLAWCVLMVAACGGLTKALMKALLGVNTWSGWDPMAGLGTEDITDGAVATVLGLLGCVLWLAALGHLLVMLARAAALIVLVATGPITAAGLVADAGRSWFWKSLRWFHAGAFTPVLMVLVLGIGVQLSTGVAAGLADGDQKAIGTALPSVLLICVSAVAPLALFKLLAFVDPGTPSGASFRQGMTMAGGLQGLLSGGGGGGGRSTGSSAASQTDGHGRSSGEAGAETSTSDRFSKSAQSGLSSFGGGIGQALAAGMGVVQKVGAVGTSLMADQTNQAGVGHQTYGPDFSGLRTNGGSSSGGSQGHPGTGSDGSGDGSDGDTGGDDGTSTPPMPTPPTPPTPTPPTPPTPPTSPTLPGSSQGADGPGTGQGGAGGGKPPSPGSGAGGAGGAGGSGAAGGATGGGAVAAL